MEHSQVCLTTATTGKVYSISHLEGETETKLRMINMGFHKGSQIEILQRRDRNTVVNVDGSRFALDQDIVANIYIEARAK